MLESMTRLVALQGRIIASYLELSVSLLDVCLWWLPATSNTAPLPQSRSLVPVDLSVAS